MIPIAPIRMHKKNDLADAINGSQKLQNNQHHWKHTDYDRCLRKHCKNKGHRPIKQKKHTNAKRTVEYSSTLCHAYSTMRGIKDARSIIVDTFVDS
jgi:hypothetical protein